MSVQSVTLAEHSTSTSFMLGTSSGVALSECFVVVASPRLCARVSLESQVSPESEHVFQASWSCHVVLQFHLDALYQSSGTCNYVCGHVLLQFVR